MENSYEIFEVELNFFKDLRDRNKKIDGIGASNKEINRFLKDRRISHPLGLQSKSVQVLYDRLKWLIGCLSIVILGLSLFVFIYVSIYFDFNVPAKVFGILSTLIVGSVLIIGRAKLASLICSKRSTVNQQLQYNDEFLLYLRSFADDGHVGRGRLSWLDLERVFYKAFPWDNELIEPLSKYIAPAVAIGSPDQELPSLIANLTYVKEEEDWQNTVQDLMGRSQAIAVVIGSTKWVSWEIEKIIRNGYINKTLFVIPPESSDDRKVRWNTFISSFQGTEYSLTLENLVIQDLLAISFHDDAKVIAYKSSFNKKYRSIELYYRYIAVLFSYLVNVRNEKLANKAIDADLSTQSVFGAEASDL